MVVLSVSAVLKTILGSLCRKRPQDVNPNVVVDIPPAQGSNVPQSQKSSALLLEVNRLFDQDYCTHQQKEAIINELNLCLQLNLTLEEKAGLMRLNADQTLDWLNQREQALNI